MTTGLSSSSASTAALFKVVACSYEGSLFGWNVLEENSIGDEKSTSKTNDSEPNDDTDDINTPGLTSSLSFGFNCCQASLRAVAVSRNGKFLACGGADERIKLFNLIEGRAAGELSNHSGSITSIRFFNDAFMFVGSEDNTISVWRVHDWVCVHVLGGHKEAINDIAIHPTGKLALTVSKDNTMKLWNLVHGRCGFTRRLKGSADRVAWDTTGAHYLLLANGTVQVYAAADNSCLTTLVHPCRVSQALFANLHYEQVANDANPFASLHFVTLTADTKTLYVYTLAGVKVASLCLESLGGRPKDMQIFSLDIDALAHPIQNAGLAEALMQAGELAVVGCSMGRMHVISLEAACRGLPLEACVLTTAQLRSEPRLVSLAVTPCYRQKQKSSVVSNNNASSSAKAATISRSEVDDDDEAEDMKVGKTGNKRKPVNEVKTVVDHQSDSKKAKKNKKNKKSKNNA